MKQKDTSHNAAEPGSPAQNPFIKLYDMPGYLLRRGGQFINATFDAEMGKMGLTASQLAAFLAVSIQEGMEQRELAARLNWDEATVGGMVRRLEAQGYFERRSSPKSKRGLQIYMTPKGKALYKQNDGRKQLVLSNGRSRIKTAAPRGYDWDLLAIHLK